MGPTLIVLSWILAAAHFSRAGVAPLVWLSLGMPLLLAVRRSWSARVLQLTLIAAGLEWLRTLWSLASDRHAAGEPWARLALILVAVALVTFLAAWFAGRRAGRADPTRAES